MALIKVLIIFVVILALLNKRLPLYLAMIFGSLLMIVMFRLPLATAGQTALHTLTGWDVWSVNLAMYVISVLVYELDLRHRFEDAQRAMNGLMRDPRLNTSPVLSGDSSFVVVGFGLYVETTSGLYQQLLQLRVHSLFRCMPYRCDQTSDYRREDNDTGRHCHFLQRPLCC